MLPKWKLTLFSTFLLLVINGVQANEQEAISTLQSALGRDTQLSFHPQTGLLSFIELQQHSDSRTEIQSPGTNSETAARNFIDKYRSWFGITDQRSELRVSSEFQTSSKRTPWAVRFSQTRDGLPVFGAGIVARLNRQMQIVGINAILSNTPKKNIRTVSEFKARQLALNATKRRHSLTTVEPLITESAELLIYNPALIGIPQNTEHLAYNILVHGHSHGISDSVIIDAQTGAVLLNYSNIKHALDRTVHDQANDYTLPRPSGQVKRAEGDPPSDIPQVNDAYNFSGDTYQFLFQEHGRDSLDNAGFPLVSAVRFCPNAFSCPYSNAFWDGSMMTYGDGFAVDDVVAHELIHGFTEFTSNLLYLNQSGAINESLSDIWGEFVDLSNNDATDSPQHRWKIGEDIPNSGAIRDMQDPPAMGHPDRIGSSLYYCGTLDNGGVHINSGVNNKAAYLLTDGGTFNGQTVAGIGMSKTADLYYHAQTAYLIQSSTYRNLYDALIASCADLDYPAADCGQVESALKAVEMDSQVCGQLPPPDLCPANLSVVESFLSDFEPGNPSPWTVNNIVSSNDWNTDSSLPFSGSFHMRGANPNTVTDSALETTASIAIPADSFFAFEHIADLEMDSQNPDRAYDGAVVEYSVDGGLSWSDLLATRTVFGNQYNRTISSDYSNPLAGRIAFSGLSAYHRTIVDINDLANTDTRFRFRIGTDDIVSAPGWTIDDVRIYQCNKNKFCGNHVVTVDIAAGDQPTDGNDVILGTYGPDIIDAGDGDDIICALGGNDLVHGGNGYDQLYGQAGNDELYGGDSFDDIYGGSGADKLYGDEGIDYLFGQGGADKIYEGAGYGSVWAGNGPDRIYTGDDGAYVQAGIGHDRVFGSDSRDVIEGDGGRDVIDGYGGNDLIEGGPGRDTIRGGDGDDNISGGDGVDILYGQANNDILRGNEGNDQLHGGSGTDACNGDEGARNELTACETTNTLTSFQQESTTDKPQSSPRWQVTAEIVDKLENCDLTLEECLNQ